MLPNHKEESTLPQKMHQFDKNTLSNLSPFYASRGATVWQERVNFNSLTKWDHILCAMPKQLQKI
jgi:hypothetical protein